jgi:hypothetical protein
VPGSVDPKGEAVQVIPVIVGVVGCLAGVGAGLIPDWNTTGIGNKICRGISGCIIGGAAGLGALASGPFAGCIAGLGFGAVINGVNPSCDYMFDGKICSERALCLAVKTVMFGVLGCFTAALGPSLTIAERIAIGSASGAWSWALGRIC